MGAWRAMAAARMVALAACCMLCGCGQQDLPVQSFVSEPFPEKLSAWHLFTGAGADLKPNRGVLPYDLNTPLFSDYAAKHRFVWMPSGSAAQYRDNQVFDFPVGAVLVKTFAFPLDTGGRPGAEQRIETRLLVRGTSGWVGLPYVWNKNQTEATLELAPDPVQ